MLIVVRAAVQRQVARMVVNPQLENGYTQIANELAEAFAKVNLSAYEWRILWFIMRKTYGFKKKTDAISLTQFAAGTGISTSNVIHTLARLKSRNLIVKSKDFRISEYGLNKHYDHWDSTEIDTIELDSVNPNSVQPDSVNPDNQIVSNQTTDSVYSNNKTVFEQTVTKEKKILTKNTTKRNTSSVAVETIKDIFFSFKNESRYNGIDFENDFSKMCEWYNGHKKKVKIPQLACHNWLDLTLAELQKNGNRGAGKSSSQNHGRAPVATSDDSAGVEAVWPV